MKIIITGADGSIGKALAKSLINENHIVYKAGRRKDKANELGYLYWDIANMEAPNLNDTKFDVLIHTASIGPIQRHSFYDYYRGNVLGTENVVKFARNNNIKKLIYLATVTSYGRVDSGILTKDSSRNELSDYALTKYIGEKLIEESGISYDILVLPGVVGYGCKSTWLERTAIKILNEEDVVCYNQYGNFNNVVTIESLIKYISELIKDLYNSSYRLLGSRENIQIKRMIEYLCKNLNSRSNILFEEREGGFVVNVTTDFRYKPKGIYDILDEVCNIVKHGIG